MKKVIYIILALALALCLCACHNPAPEETDSQSPEETPAPVRYSSDEGRLTKEVSCNTNGLKYLTVCYDYDGRGRVTKELRMGVNDAPEGYYTNEYDEDGKLTLRVSYVALGPEEFEEEYKISYTYDAEGRCILETSTSEGAVLAKTEYVYDENGLLTGEKHYQGESFLAAEYTYTYDEKDRTAGCVRLDNMEGETVENRYTYDAKDRVITDLKCDGDGNVIERIEYSYDEGGSGQNVLKRSVYGENGVLISLENNEYTYDEAGNVVELVSTDSEGTVTGTTEYTWAYSKG